MEPELLKQLIKNDIGVLQETFNAPASVARSFFFQKYGVQNSTALEIIGEKSLAAALRKHEKEDKQKKGSKKATGKDTERRPSYKNLAPGKGWKQQALRCTEKGDKENSGSFRTPDKLKGGEKGKSMQRKKQKETSNPYDLFNIGLGKGYEPKLYTHQEECSTAPIQNENAAQMQQWQPRQSDPNPEMGQTLGQKNQSQRPKETAIAGNQGKHPNDKNQNSEKEQNDGERNKESSPAVEEGKRMR